MNWHQRPDKWTERPGRFGARWGTLTDDDRATITGTRDTPAGLLLARELARVSAADGWLVLSTPLHAHRWQEFDRVVGHARRYDPRALVVLLRSAGFRLEGFAPFGMRPISAWLTRLGAYYMVHRPRRAFWLQEQFLRLATRTARPTQLRRAGVDAFLADAAGADGVVTAWRHCQPA